MPVLREYVVDIGGLPHTILLNEEDARRANADPKARPEVSNKARKDVRNKSKEG